jgi:uncharacterized membrane protein YhiD involved in acid resistance
MELLFGQPSPGSLLELSVRIVLALVAGSLIGLERQWHQKSAGIRTHALLALGAASFSLISHLLHLANPEINPTQIAGGVVSGIGFICGGVIMHRGGSVHGLNTATSLWTTAGVGLAVGGGFHCLAWTLTVAVLTVQFPLGWIEDALDRRVRTPKSTWRVVLRGDRLPPRVIALASPSNRSPGNSVLRLTAGSTTNNFWNWSMKSKAGRTARTF